VIKVDKSSYYPYLKTKGYKNLVGTKKGK